MSTKPLSSLGRLGRSFLKRFMYSQMAARTGLMIALGKEHPLVKFTVEDDPPSLYIVFRIRPSKLEALSREIELPTGFSLTPIQCLEGDEPDYLMVVNAYRVSGLTNGLRAEWSVFVRDASSTPRYLILDARSSTTSMDPLTIITKASPVSHAKDGDLLLTRIGEEGEEFEAEISLAGSAQYAISSRAWVTANDHIYWGNGVSDRTFYDAGLANAKQRRIDMADVKITDNTIWGTFVEPEPVHALVLEEAIEFVISPWENIDRLEIER